MASRVPLIRDIDDRYDKQIFISLVAGGIIILLATRLVGDLIFANSGIGFFDILAIILAVFFIMGYAAFIYASSSRSSLSIDRASDNVYYLGLLYTLTSLGYSLIKLGFAITVDPVTRGYFGQGITSFKFIARFWVSPCINDFWHIFSGLAAADEGMS